MAFTLNLGREVRKDRPDLLHFASYFNSIFMFSSIPTIRIPTVVWFTGGDVPKGGLRRWLWFFALGPSLKKARGVLMGDYPERQRTLFWLLRGRSNKVTPFQLLRVEQKAFAPRERAEARRELGYNHEICVISVLSVIPLPHDDPENRQPFGMLKVFASALKSIPVGIGAKVLVVGLGPGLRHLQDHAKDLGVQDLVEFPGRIEHDQLPKFYSASDLVFVPSRLEALNETNVLAEAFSCGTPVVAFRRRAGLAMYQPGGFLISEDSVQGGKELASILTKPEVLKEKSKEALSLAGQFSLETAGAELLSVYSKVFSGHLSQ